MSSQLAYLYIAFWTSLCLAAAMLAFRDRKSLALFRPDYRKFLFQPWKVATFAVATVGLAVIAPYSGDYTWDYVDATFMAVFTYLTAPWAAGLHVHGRDRSRDGGLLPGALLQVSVCDALSAMRV